MDRPIVGKIRNIQELLSIDILNMYTYDVNYNKNKTFHQYSRELPSYVRDRFEYIQNGHIMRKLKHLYIDNIVENIDGMNELYISAIGSNGSDKVFETMHIDGPFCFLPFCTVLRCIVAIQGTPNIITAFPFVTQEHALLTNDYLAFDYNRDTHFIYEKPGTITRDSRILLKLHYLIVPRFIPRSVANFYKKTHVLYNSFMRTTFLASQKDSLLAKTINGSTIFYCWFYKNKKNIAAIAGLTFLVWFIPMNF